MSNYNSTPNPGDVVAPRRELNSEQGWEGNPDGIFNSEGPTKFPGDISPRTLWDLKHASILTNFHIG